MTYFYWGFTDSGKSYTQRLARTNGKVEARFMAAITFSGQMNAKLAHAKREELQGHLEEAGIRKIQGTWQSGQYNPPYTIPFLRTNEILVQVDESSLPRE